MIKRKTCKKCDKFLSKSNKTGYCMQHGPKHRSYAVPKIKLKNNSLYAEIVRKQRFLPSLEQHVREIRLNNNLK